MHPLETTTQVLRGAKVSAPGVKEPERCETLHFPAMPPSRSSSVGKSARIAAAPYMVESFTYQNQSGSSGSTNPAASTPGSSNIQVVNSSDLQMSPIGLDSTAAAGGSGRLTAPPPNAPSSGALVAPTGQPHCYTPSPPPQQVHDVGQYEYENRGASHGTHAQQNNA